MIIVDTREQKPLWDPAFFNVKSQKMDEGDYTTEELLGIAHIERKSGCDLYGSIIQGHTRFRAELQRAIDKKIKLAVFVECTKSDFVMKKFRGGHRLKTPGSTLMKIVMTISKKYNVDFHWCDGRDDLRDKMCNWFVNQLEKVEGVEGTNDPEKLKIARKNIVGFKDA